MVPNSDDSLAVLLMSGDVGKWDFLRWRFAECFWGEWIPWMHGPSLMFYMGVQQRINQETWDFSHIKKCWFNIIRGGNGAKPPQENHFQAMNVGFCPLHQWLPSHLIAILQFILYDKNPQYIGYVKYNNRIKNPARVSNTAHCRLIQKQGWSGSINPGERYGSKRCQENS